VIVDHAKQGIGISRCLDLPATFDSGRVDPSGRSRKSRRARLDRLAATIPHFSGERLRLGPSAPASSSSNPAKTGSSLRAASHLFRFDLELASAPH